MIVYKNHIIKRNKFLIRLKTAWKILTGQYKHWVLVDVTEDNFKKIIKEETFDCNFVYSGLRPFLYFQMLKKVAASKDDIDMMLDKGQFEADAIEYLDKKKKL